MSSEVPTEVSNHLNWYLSGEKPEDVRFFAKSEFSRSKAWTQVPVFHDRDNPWRKAHTENFWVWFQVEVPVRENWGDRKPKHAGQDTKASHTMTYDERLKDIIDRLTEAARAELDATDAGRFKRIKICCEHAEDLLRETAQSVEDFEALEDDEDDILGVPRRRRRRRRAPRPGAGALLPDNANIMRTAMESLGQQNNNLQTGNRLKALDLVVKMKKEGLDQDPDLKGAYNDLVHSDILRRLPPIDVQGQDQAQGDESDGPGEEAASRVPGGGDLTLLGFGEGGLPREGGDHHRCTDLRGIDRAGDDPQAGPQADLGDQGVEGQDGGDHLAGPSYRYDRD